MADDRSGQDSADKSFLEKISSLFSAEPRTREDLEDVLTAAQENELIDEEAKGIIEGAMQVSAMQARDIMVPRSHMIVIKSEWSLGEMLPKIIESGHSRYPVIGESGDDVQGILLTKDLLPRILEENSEDFDVTELLRPATCVPESKRLNVLLKEFRENRNHMAVVIDEYGGVAGLITIEDVLEEIVGEIEDETDAEADRLIRKIAEGDYIIQALTPIEEFNDYFNVEFSDEEFDTIGGLVIQAFGHMPARHENTSIDDFQFTVINANQRRIESLRLQIGVA